MCCYSTIRPDGDQFHIYESSHVVYFFWLRYLLKAFFHSFERQFVRIFRLLTYFVSRQVRSRLNVERAFAPCRLHTSFLFKKILWGLLGVFNSECPVSWCCYCSVQPPGSTLQPAKFFKRSQRTPFTWFTKSGNWGWVLLIKRPLVRWRHISTTTRILQSFAVFFFSLVQSFFSNPGSSKWRHRANASCISFVQTPLERRSFKSFSLTCRNCVI